jgi:hypothetical protein
MLPRLRLAHIPAPALVALTVLVGLVVVAVYRGAHSAPQPSAVCMDDWDVRDLAGYLEGRGLKLHLYPTWDGGNTSRNAFLATTEKTGAEMYGLVKGTTAMDRWAGVVYCERLRLPEDREEILQLWAGCGLRADPFAFFGDPELLARIRTALGDALSSRTRSWDP